MAGSIVMPGGRWYNIHSENIIPAHTGFRARRGKPGAKIRRRHHGRAVDMV